MTIDVKKIDDQNQYWEIETSTWHDYGASWIKLNLNLF